jgi:UDP-3-O-[3-hydroxymyristoyl] N-acetylglucosamine deacetylase
MGQSQRTLMRSVEGTGVGLHSGARARIRISPGDANSGIVFVRRDLRLVEIPARHELLNGTSLSTTLSRGAASIATVEHVLSALHGMGVDNARVEVDGPEVPILDGSALPFVEMIRSAGIRRQKAPRRHMILTRPVSVQHGDKQIIALPANEFQATYAIDFPHPAIGYQAVSATIDEDLYTASIAPARTFCLLRDVEAMRRSGLALGGSLDNALVIGDGGVLNGTLRFPDECVRHKVLDLIGDLALLGRPLRAHVIAIKGGHRLHAALVAAIVAARAAWSVGVAEATIPEARVAEFARLGERLVPRAAALAV